MGSGSSVRESVEIGYEQFLELRKYACIFCARLVYCTKHKCFECSYLSGVLLEVRCEHFVRNVKVNVAAPWELVE